MRLTKKKKARAACFDELLSLLCFGGADFRFGLNLIRVRLRSRVMKRGRRKVSSATTKKRNLSRKSAVTVSRQKPGFQTSSFLSI